MKAPLTIRLRLQPVNGLHSFDYSLRDRFVGDMASASPARPCQGYAAFSKWRTRLSHSASRFHLGKVCATISKLLILKTGHEPGEDPVPANNSI